MGSVCVEDRDCGDGQHCENEICGRCSDGRIDRGELCSEAGEVSEPTAPLVEVALLDAGPSRDPLVVGLREDGTLEALGNAAASGEAGAARLGVTPSGVIRAMAVSPGGTELLLAYAEAPRLELFGSDAMGAFSSLWIAELGDAIGRVREVRFHRGAVAVATDRGLWAYPRTGEGLGDRVDLVTTERAVPLEFVDLDADAVPEIAAVLPDSGRVLVFEGGVTRRGVVEVVFEGASEARFVDLDGAGPLDLVVLARDEGRLSSFLREDSGHFVPVDEVELSVGASDLGFADLTADGVPDLVTTVPGASLAEILVSREGRLGDRGSIALPIAADRVLVVHEEADVLFVERETGRWIRLEASP